MSYEPALICTIKYICYEYSLTNNKTHLNCVEEEEGSLSKFAIKDVQLLYTLLALITPALSQRRPILRLPLFRQEQISTYRHLGPRLTPR